MIYIDTFEKVSQNFPLCFCDTFFKKYQKVSKKKLKYYNLILNILVNSI